MPSIPIKFSFGTTTFSGRPNKINGLVRDFGYEVLGSFTGHYEICVDCSHCLKSLDMTIENNMSMASLTRMPMSRMSLISYPILKTIEMKFVYLVVENVK